ncbi:MAG TPA: metal ABC transporter substrate-binding protein [Chloroflexota bacterium]|nr:metal ABC transporter substrate-binding protein [Chloroflexota bacterium]
MSGQASWRGLAAAALALLLVLAALLAPASAQPQPHGGPRVVTSTTVFADLVQQVGGDRLASVDSVVPAGVDVEDYDPKPGDLQTVAQASLLVMNGLALDRWVPKLVQSANPGVTTLVLSDGLPVLGIGASDDEDIAQNGNPHFWLDPQYAKVYARKIHDQLVALDPDGQAVYDANTTAYLSQLDALDQWIRQQVATIPPDNRKLVTFHEAYPYFAARYGFQLIGVITPSPGQEPSAGELAQLIAAVKAAQVKAVFSEAQFSPRLTQTLAQEAGVQQVVADLYNDSLGDPPADSYIGMMRYNVERIVQALA